MMNEKTDTKVDDFLYGLAYLPVRGGQWLFAARGSGLYVSQDGTNWEVATKSLEIQDAYSATAVAVVPGSSDPASVSDEVESLYPSPDIFLGLAGGILHSRDGGVHWFSSRLPKPPPVISCIAVSPGYEKDGIVLAGSLEDGVLRSADRGSSWVTWNFGLLDLAVMSLAISPDFDEDETVLAGTESGLFRSTNGGRAWREIPLPVGYEPVISLAFSPCYACEGKRNELIYAGTESQGLFVSNDHMKTWQKVNQPGLESMIQSILFSPFYPDEPAITVVAEGKIYLSRDSGHHWDEIWPDVTEQQSAGMILAPRGMKPGQSAWLGLADGQVKRVIFP